MLNEGRNLSEIDFVVSKVFVEVNVCVEHIRFLYNLIKAELNSIYFF